MNSTYLIAEALPEIVATSDERENQLAELERGAEVADPERIPK